VSWAPSTGRRPQRSSRSWCCSSADEAGAWGCRRDSTTRRSATPSGRDRRLAHSVTAHEPRPMTLRPRRVSARWPACARRSRSASARGWCRSSRT
jgi:hypothetical protein